MITSLAVVPIFVNAGAAVLPAIMGGLLSGVALLFKPRELLRLFRRRPYVPVIIVALGVGGWFGFQWMETLGNEARPPVGPPPMDWREVGQRIVNQRHRDASAANWFISLPNQICAGSWPELPAFISVTKAPQTDIVMGRDYSRCGYDGGAVPQGLREEWS